MPDRLRLTILGCGSSPGVPRIMGDWGDCNPDNPKNRRTRASALIERIKPDGRRTSVVIDTGPDFRQQMLSAQVQHLDGVVYTHPHADHIHGVDDLRGYVLAKDKRMDIHADAFTLERLRDGFLYCFETPAGSEYPPILTAHVIDHDRDFTIEGEGGPLTFTPLPQVHGLIGSLGFRIGALAYCSDVNHFPDATLARLHGLDVLVIDALQYRRHPNHFSLSEALAHIEQLQPKRAILTHMHIPMDFDAVAAQTPAHVEPAFDGLSVDIPILD